jgi:thiol-disulfide isomerase/thioredoxin
LGLRFAQAILYADTLSEYRQGDDQTLDEFVEAAVAGTMPKYNASAPLPQSPLSAEALRAIDQRREQKRLLKEKADLASKVVDLDDENCDELVKEGEVWMIDFYTPWCKHCHDLKPQFEKAAKMYSQSQGQKTKYAARINFGAVNSERGALGLVKRYVIPIPIRYAIRKKTSSQKVMSSSHRSTALLPG